MADVAHREAVPRWVRVGHCSVGPEPVRFGGQPHEEPGEYNVPVRPRYNRRMYLSVSDAARAAAGKPRNGWCFWKVKSAAGEWVTLRELVGK